LWIERNLEALAASGVRLAVGVGGAIDVLGGKVPRAPRWMRQRGLEWLYRLVREPWRWRRQLALPRFVILVFAQRLGLIGSHREEQGDTMDYA
jgi:N-acetylglucosaminyldiphosphoundecaprenol N-acetyl-beta-D-mannosaminyltransferase